MIVLSLLLKYLFEGLAVAIAAFVIPKSKLKIEEIILVGLTAMAIFALLDIFTPHVGHGVRHGAGFGIGYKQFGLGLNGSLGLEPFEQNSNPDQGSESVTVTVKGENQNNDSMGTYEPHLYAEAFTNSDEPFINGTGAVNDPDSIGTCAMNGTTCTYATTATPLQQSKYVCHVVSGNCQPMFACQETNGTCALRDSANGLSDTVGKTCIMEAVPAKSVCRLSNQTGGNMEGFEGFAKVY